MRLIIGLGNPEETYEHTRHNAGFLVLDALAERFNTIFQSKRAWKANVAQTRIGDERVLLLKPKTYMNKSGRALQAALRQSNLSPEDVLVIYDDIDLPFGTIRFRVDGSAAGHNGMRSLLQILPADAALARLRVGIGRPENERLPIKEWVLQQWTDDERAQLPEIVDKTADRAVQWIQDHID